MVCLDASDFAFLAICLADQDVVWLWFATSFEQRLFNLAQVRFVLTSRLKERAWENQLGARLVIASIFVSTVLSAFSTGIQLITSYRLQSKQALEELDQTELVVAEALEQALWTFDFEHVEILLKGLHSVPAVHEVRLTSTSGQKWLLGESKTREYVRDYDLEYQQASGTTETLGHLQIAVSMQNVVDSVLTQFWTLLVSNFAKTIMAAMAMMLIFQMIVTDHLRQIARHVGTTLPLDRRRKLSLNRKPREHPDDLDKIVAALSAYEARVDKTVRQLAQEVLERTKAEHEAQTAVSIRNNFIANISHEIRTPLNAMLGLFHLIAKDEQATEKLKQHSQVGTQAGQQLLHQLNNVLDMARLDSNSITIQRSETDVRALAKHWQETAKASAAMKSSCIDVQLELDPNLAPTHLIDAMRVSEIVTNLTDNAIKFTQTGKVVVRVEQENAFSLTISVLDTGIGIPEAQREQVFTRFGRGDSSMERMAGGTGLGLTICLELAKLMSGTLDYEAQDGSPFKSKFVLRLSTQENRGQHE